jgi:hypothetical protein
MHTQVHTLMYVHVCVCVCVSIKCLLSLGYEMFLTEFYKQSVSLKSVVTNFIDFPCHLVFNIFQFIK